ncbi:ATP-dependent RNA helicase DDX42 [Lepeophtheirus salmonis]|uniref:ATP-dependent RNA helicase DDX42 n=1 Tax=Lepeophtheirus salmonis TaxID=72036 RepID=A0A0K2T725_LEPSM|nr:ATP-dependent RNA helicase DDX42-like [Lepeophtheirus salmonis]
MSRHRRGGGLYAHFVNDSSSGDRPYRGAEIPPPSSLSSRQSSSAGRNPNPNSNSGTTNSSKSFNYKDFQELPIKKTRSEEDYFNEDEEDDKEKERKKQEESFCPYIPSPGSPGYIPPSSQKSPKKSEDEDEEEDSLDTFMANLEKDAKSQGLKSLNKPKDTTKTFKGVRTDIDEADNEESYYKWLEENPNAGLMPVDEDDDDIEYDEDGNPIAPKLPKYIDPLPPMDHSAIEYMPFDKCFYKEHNDITCLSPIQVIDLQQKLGIKISGVSPPKPVTSFGHFGFDEVLLKSIRKSEFTQPTPIQSIGIPVCLSGRDAIGIAKTGSGKTATFLWPIIIHIQHQRPLLNGEGPIALILVPTRELALQIYTEAKKFGKVYDLNAVCAYGGGSKWEQSKCFESGAEIAIATPGRMIDMIKMKVTNLQRVTYLVLDEADRMFDMGFEAQVRSICDHVRPDRQTLLFSATFKKKVEKLARDVLTDPIKVVQGSIGEASEDVTQIVKVLEKGGYKWEWVLQNLVEFTSAGSVLIFVTKKLNCEELAQNLKLKEFECELIHGDLNQHVRNEIIYKFKKKQFPILVATDVAARGLDIPHIRTVLNYDIARDIDTHTHRIGRTGRAGIKGTAYTLVTEKDKEFAGHIVRNLEQANQDVPKELMDLAMQSSWFKNSRFKKGKMGKTVGLGFKESVDSLNGDSKAISGPVSGGRLGVVREAYKNQFMTNFRKASDEATSSDQPSMPPPPPPPSNQPTIPSLDSSSQKTGKKRKSRWD